MYELTGFAHLPARDIDALWRLGDGKAALLYLFFITNNRLPYAEEMTVGGFTPQELIQARKMLESAGLISLSIERKTRERPRYEAHEIASGISRDAGFAFVVREAERMRGKKLSSSDLETLFSIYEWRGLPPDVLCMLITFVVNDFKKKFGENSSPPTLKQLDTEAVIWENAGIFTADSAEKYIAERERQGTASVSSKPLPQDGKKSRVEKSNRPIAAPGDAEKKAMEKTLEFLRSTQKEE